MDAHEDGHTKHGAGTIRHASATSGKQGCAIHETGLCTRLLKNKAPTLKWRLRQDTLGCHQSFQLKSQFLGFNLSPLKDDGR